MAYEVVMPYHLHMPSYFLETFTEYPSKMTKDTIPYLPSIVQTETQQFLQLEIALIILRQLHAIIIAGMNE